MALIRLKLRNFTSGRFWTFLIDDLYCWPFYILGDVKMTHISFLSLLGFMMISVAVPALANSPLDPREMENEIDPIEQGEKDPVPGKDPMKQPAEAE